MYTPHTVTLIIAEETDDGMAYNSVILSGVFLDLSKRSNVNKSGLADADRATLYIPLSISTDAQYVTPKAYSALESKSGYWTIFDGGESSSSECYFIKGAVENAAISYAEAQRTYDFVYRVTSVDLRDFGRTQMQHWMVGGR